MSEQRFIEYGTKRIPVADGMTQEQAKQQMARFFPELADPKIESKKEKDATVWVFSKKAGTKGALARWDANAVAQLIVDDHQSDLINASLKSILDKARNIPEAEHAVTEWLLKHLGAPAPRPPASPAVHA